MDRSARQKQVHREFRAKKPEKAADFLPDPETLEAYNYVIEGSAPKIIEMIEAEQAHRHAIENRALTIQQNAMIMGQIFGAVVAVVLLAVVAMLAGDGNVQWAGAIAIVGFSCMTLAFVKGRQLVEIQRRRVQGTGDTPNRPSHVKHNKGQQQRNRNRRRYVPEQQPPL